MRVCDTPSIVVLDPDFGIVWINGRCQNPLSFPLEIAGLELTNKPAFICIVSALGIWVGIDLSF